MSFSKAEFKYQGAIGHFHGYSNTARLCMKSMTAFRGGGGGGGGANRRALAPTPPPPPPPPPLRLLERRYVRCPPELLENLTLSIVFCVIYIKKKFFLVCGFRRGSNPATIFKAILWL